MTLLSLSRRDPDQGFFLVEKVSVDLPVNVEMDSDIFWPKRIKARPRIQRTFDAWYRANLHRFRIKLQLVRRTDAGLDIAFNGITRVIKAWLSDGEISVYVTWKDTWWDSLTWIETYPKRVTGGYVCTECDPLTRKTFSSREALWEFELFEEFLEWVNEVLAPAQILELYGDEGMTNARLKVTAV